ncbi:putative lipid kinase BmrU [Halobacillus andaensis]|uniref:Lipid kinase BmrU n=1 Tax=Halobacillus andaensis TaxID=1176239 RepID=A0A917BBD1_HALAA|nr:YegS/Rv2252/BmrU family lipid kinase [Halobacillus andaensis]MBP2006213.1 YegS/Rv2252/BmrU family lipid kinase [Halobacillus andaensis]GGF33320.1 putative lipid kinase BmrU [Halobacillus andaensis]
MPRYERGLFIYNGNAGNGELEQNLSETIPVITQQVKELQVIQTESLEDFKETCCSYGPYVDVLFILGGDGTLHECINCMAELTPKPVISILPGGTCNDFSRVLGTPQALRQAAEAAIKGEEVSVDIGKSNDDFFINFWGIGLITETSTNIDKGQKDRFGVLSYFISAFKTMNQADSFHFTAEVDGEKIRDEAVMVLVMNGRFVGTREVPIPDTRPEDGKLDVLIIKNSNLTLFRELLSMNKPWSDPENFQELTYLQGEDIKINVETAQKIDMDGEIKGETPTHIQVLSNHFTFLAPDPAVVKNIQRFANGNDR